MITSMIKITIKMPKQKNRAHDSHRRIEIRGKDFQQRPCGLNVTGQNVLKNPLKMDATEQAGATVSVANSGGLKGKQAVCFPSMQDKLAQQGATGGPQSVLQDGRLLTAVGHPKPPGNSAKPWSRC